MLRGSRDFTSKREYMNFLEDLFSQLNSNRKDRFMEEQSALGSLPLKQLPACTRLDLRVGPSSTIRVKHNVYSVHAGLSGKRLQ